VRTFSVELAEEGIEALLLLQAWSLRATATQRPAKHMRRAPHAYALYVEQRDQGDYAVRRGGAQRASDVLPTQREAIERARELNPGHSPVVERVRHTNVGKPDQWRKA
jgi:hypothetical protein